jgi:hypothetical protein
MKNIDTSDIPPLTAEFWTKAKLRSPKKITTSVQIDQFLTYLRKLRDT